MTKQITDGMILIVVRQTFHTCGCGGMADAQDSKSCGGDLVWVQVPPSARKELWYVPRFFFMVMNKVTIRTTVQKQCFLRASTTLHCFCTVSLNSYGLYNNITRLPIEKQEKNGILKEILRGRGKTCQITFLLHYPNIVRRISCRCICRGTKEIRCV